MDKVNIPTAERGCNCKENPGFKSFCANYVKAQAQTWQTWQDALPLLVLALGSFI